MRRIDRWIGAGLAALGAAVVWSARAFPNVPGQRLGAAFLPTIIGVGLLLCGLALIARSLRQVAYAESASTTQRQAEHYASSAVVVAAVTAYIAFADTLGFLIVAPLCLIATFLAFRVRPAHAALWAIAGTLVVHIAFYKLLRVPLPWGLLRPLY